MKKEPETTRKLGFWSLTKLYVQAWFEERARDPQVSLLETRAQIAERESQAIRAENELERARKERSGLLISETDFTTYYDIDDSKDPL